MKIDYKSIVLKFIYELTNHTYVEDSLGEIDSVMKQIDSGYDVKSFPGEDYISELRQYLKRAHELMTPKCSITGCEEKAIRGVISHPSLKPENIDFTNSEPVEHVAVTKYACEEHLSSLEIE